MNVHLTPEMVQLVNGKVESGNYSSASEVVQEALRLMQERDQFTNIQKDDIRRKISVGLDSLRAGKGIDGESYMAQLDAELAAEIDGEERQRIGTATSAA